MPSRVINNGPVRLRIGYWDAPDEPQRFANINGGTELAEGLDIYGPVEVIAQTKAAADWFNSLNDPDDPDPIERGDVVFSAVLTPGQHVVIGDDFTLSVLNEVP